MISFSVEQDNNAKAKPYVYIRAKHNDTVGKIMSRRGHPELIHEVGLLNHIRSRSTKLKAGRLLRIPGATAVGPTLHVLADDPPPVITGGYAKYDTIDVHGRKGLSRFRGYDPITMDIPIQFEAWADFGTGSGQWLRGDGRDIERDIAALEQMAGRGHFAHAAVGPPATIRISVTNANNQVAFLVPPNFQWSEQNPHAPIYRITDIKWDQAKVLRHPTTGRRMRQSAVVTVTEYTQLQLVERSAAQRSKKRNTKKKSTGQKKQ